MLPALMVTQIRAMVLCRDLSCDLNDLKSSAIIMERIMDERMHWRAKFKITLRHCTFQTHTVRDRACTALRR